MPFVAGTALAQFEEIIVTAQKRAQNLQVVPVSISAISRDDIEANRNQSFADARFGDLRAGQNLRAGCALHGRRAL